MTAVDLNRFRRCPIGCNWKQSATEYDDETGLRAARSQHLFTRHSPYEIITTLDRGAAALAALEQDRDRLQAELTVVRRERAWLISNLDDAELEEFRLLAQTAERAREDGDAILPPKRT